MAVWVRAPLGDLAIRNVQRCVQVDDAVTLVVVRVASGASFAKRQRKLRTLERLNLRLLVDAQHDRVLRRVDAQTRRGRVQGRVRADL